MSATKDERRSSPKHKAEPAGAAATGPSGDDGPMRIAKAMARAGLCSRRDAERWIAEGRVTLNGLALNTPAVTVTARDHIVVDGQPMAQAAPARLWRYHKPRGRVTTHKDPEGRPTVFAALPEDMPRVVSIGRLDFNTEGLLLLTTAGALARHLELPATGWLRRYRVRANGKVTQTQLDSLAKGIEIEGVRYGPIEARLDRQQGANVWLTIGLREGKNREVRKVLGTFGLDVSRLIRLSFGPFALGELVPGAVDEVAPRVIAEQIGPALTAELGISVADTDPRPARREAKAATATEKPDLRRPTGRAKGRPPEAKHRQTIPENDRRGGRAQSKKPS